MNKLLSFSILSLMFLTACDSYDSNQYVLSEKYIGMDNFIHDCLASHDRKAILDEMKKPVPQFEDKDGSVVRINMNRMEFFQLDTEVTSQHKCL